MRCCKENISTFDIASHGNSWKRLYVEKYIENLIEKFRPMQSDMFDIKDLLPTLEPFIKRLEITELLPPNIQVVSHKQAIVRGDVQTLKFSPVPTLLEMVILYSTN